MTLNFSDYEEKLDISKLSKIKVFNFDDYGKRFFPNISFPSGANEIEIFFGATNVFHSIEDFIIHIKSMSYARNIIYNIPKAFGDINLILNKLREEIFYREIDAYFEGFFDQAFYANVISNPWMVKLRLSDFIEGYKIKTMYPGSYLVCQSKLHYMYFAYSSID